MIALNTFESYRVYTLDTLSRLGEAVELGREIIGGSKINRLALDPVVDELIWSLQKDPVIGDLMQREIAELKKITNEKNYSIEEFLFVTTNIFRSTEGQYKLNIENFILEIFSNPARRNDLRKATGFYCSHLVNLGYTREYITGVVNEKFFDRAPQRVGRKTLSGFFGVFDGKLKKYTVQLGVSSEFGMYLKKLDFSVSNRDPLNSSIESCIVNNQNEKALLSVVTRATKQLDPFAAMNAVQQEISTFKAFSFLSAFGLHAEWGERMLVTQSKSKKSVEVQPQKLTLTRALDPAKPSEARSNNISTYAHLININFLDSSAERLRSAIGTAALATLSPNPENQLISLWSAIEVMLSDPKDVARIVHYTDIIAPTVCLRHIRRQLFSSHNEMLVNYRKKYLEIISRVPNAGSTSFSALANCLFLSENVAQQRDLLSICSDNPLALQRLYKLHCNYKTVGSTRESLDEHSARVRWQINRLYRARNGLVHSGKVPVYIESLILNAAEYLRSAMSSIIIKSRSGTYLYSVDQAAADIKLQYNIIRSSFDGRKKDEPITLADVNRLLT